MDRMLTVHEITRWGPCSSEPGERYSPEGLRRLFGGESISVQGIADLPIPPEDKLWVWLRPQVIPERDLHLLACLFAEHVQPPDADPRSLEATRVKRAWVRGEATDEELDAASDAAWAAAWKAALSAAWVVARASARVAAKAAASAAAREAACAAVGDAAKAATRGAEREWQVAQVLAYLRDEVTLDNERAR